MIATRRLPTKTNQSSSFTQMQFEQRKKDPLSIDNLEAWSCSCDGGKSNNKGSVGGNDNHMALLLHGKEDPDNKDNSAISHFCIHKIPEM